ncbi:MAG: relaxase/mobilization nuclease domain-containing protein [Steroidobacteraceae bacterium]
MPKSLVRLGGEVPWLDIGSYGRLGPTRRDRLSQEQLAVIAHTVRRSPEVMVKMLNAGGRDLPSVARHFEYLDRGGELEIETDEGEKLKGKGTAAALVEDWELALDAQRPATADHKPRQAGKSPKLVHKMIFSMPAGTPPEKVLSAVKDFAREEFGAKHRYAMVMHTDEPHPHVHLVVRAAGYDGRRLRICKATLRDWRREFAHHLREHGVAANATERAVRGVTKPQKSDGIYRAGKRRASTHWNQRAASVSREMAASGNIDAEPGKSQMLRTRQDVVRGWTELADDLLLQGQVELAQAVRAFVKQLPPVRTEREWVRDALLKRAAAERDRAVANWRAFRAQEQKAAEQVRQGELDRTRRRDPEALRERSRDQDRGRTR